MEAFCATVKRLDFICKQQIVVHFFCLKIFQTFIYFLENLINAHDTKFKRQKGMQSGVSLLALIPQ